MGIQIRANILCNSRHNVGYMQDSLYITSPIYYVNDKPHLGTAYTSILIDIFKRYHLLFGDEVFFLTGTDEHGQKCLQRAESLGKSPKEHCDEMSEVFKQTWKKLNIDYNFFIRTTDEDHKQGVSRLLLELWDKKLIYKSKYKGWYSVREEIFYTEKDIKDKSPSFKKELVPIEEENYFFKMSQYQQALIEHLNKNPDFIQPAYRQNELKGFLKKPLQDLCISRPKTRVSWGVELPFDQDYVAYVWVDALINYLTGISFGRDEACFNKWWKQARSVHFIGKDILITHGIYWPCLLLALDLPLPRHILAHGWLLNKDKDKMSKSKGEVIDPLKISEKISTDGLRYFLAREVILGNDAGISEAGIFQRYNQDLAGNLGNIFSRISRLIDKNYQGQIPDLDEGDLNEARFDEIRQQVSSFVSKNIKNFHLQQSLVEIFKLLDKTNQFLEEGQPWKLVKSDPKKAGAILHISLKNLIFAARMLEPVMPEKMKKILCIDLKARLTHSDPLFPRVQ